ncbi:MAG: ABC transporter ATP-binding protein [Synergistaceae bacterium]|jgi:sn-glycerol 3-phosphate transport system ATP-binding protein|nr:ABC transporter ATP-binding protein [Synergistaceae bacterium]
MKEIVMENVCKSYGGTGVVSDLNISVGSGERLILLGPSGCGKSTILRMIAGLEDITSGSLYLGGRRVNDVESGRRNVSMVFQNYALFPHMNVEDNITYGLRVNRIPRDEIARRKAEVVNMLELSGLEGRKPRELSGGQKQRVALARAVAKRSDFLLLDEPLSNLDAQLREHARKELVKVHEKSGATMVYVTHDQVEAMTVGDRIALLSGGTVQMFDTPSNIYNRPANVFTAKFIGAPSCNIAPARVKGGRISFGGEWFAPGGRWREILSGRSEVRFGARPEHVHLHTDARPNSVRAVVKYSENYGNRTSVFTSVGETEIAVSGEDICFAPGETAYLSFDPDRIHLFDADTEENIGYPDDTRRGEDDEFIYKHNVA